MATTTKSKSGKAVSKDMSDVRDRSTGQIPRAREKEAQALLGDKDIAQTYVKCTWWGGCYYCKDKTGTWRAIECYA